MGSICRWMGGGRRDCDTGCRAWDVQVAVTRNRLIGAGAAVWLLAVLMAIVMMTPARAPAPPPAGWVLAVLNICSYLVVPAVLLGAVLLIVGWLRTEEGGAGSTSVSSERDRDAD